MRERALHVALAVQLVSCVVSVEPIDVPAHALTERRLTEELDLSTYDTQPRVGLHRCNLRGEPPPNPEVVGVHAAR